MEHQFDWVEIWRVLRQVSQFRSTGLDCLLHAGDLVEGDVVDGDDVPPPKSRGEALFDISEDASPFMAPLISIGATIPVRRKPAMNVSVSQRPIGTSPIRRSPRGLQPLGRTMLVVTAVSSINTRRAGSSSPCSRIQRRRFRATSSRFRSAARRLFFNSDAVTSEKSGERAATSRNSPLA